MNVISKKGEIATLLNFEGGVFERLEQYNHLTDDYKVEWLKQDYVSRHFLYIEDESEIQRLEDAYSQQKSPLK